MSTEFKYPAIPPCELDERQAIIGDNGKQIATLTDYWRWAHSDLLGNTERGIFAEYLVRLALQIKEPRLSWGKYDLLYKKHIKIEVKSSAYIQTWGQKTLSSISFSISPSYGWDYENNSYEKEKKRQSDIYVFCLLDCKEQEKIQPIDVTQWRFFILSTKALNEYSLTAKSISLSSLKKLPVVECDFYHIKESIDKMNI
ncbi:MAG: hypothetical protein ACI4JE_05625 [Ruminococcus sp.]